MSQPELSVVVALISGRKADLRSCLQALHAQEDAPELEIIVPYDDTCADVCTLAPEFPDVQFTRAAGLDTAHARRGFSREHHDTLRTIGLRQARGRFVALTEDHAHAAATSCREMVAALERHASAGAVGGAVECDSARALNWAVWFCDFGRYQNPLPDGIAVFVSDSNVAYRTSALEAIAEVWADDYHEPVVHAALEKAGFELRTSPAIVVWQARSGLRWTEAMRERYVWARSYAATRAKLVSAPKRWTLAAATPVLPLLMTARLFRTSVERGAHVRRFLVVLPVILALQTVWAAGELAGYVTADPS